METVEPAYEGLGLNESFWIISFSKNLKNYPKFDNLPKKFGPRLSLGLML